MITKLWQRVAAWLRRMVRDFYFWFCREERLKQATHFRSLAEALDRLAPGRAKTDTMGAGIMHGEASIYRKWASTIERSSNARITHD